MAIKGYTLPAERGNSTAQYNLGIMYSFGLDISQEYNTAVNWYLRSAEQANTFAQYHQSGDYII